MLIDLTSDLHGFLPELPGGDILIICGDLTGQDKPHEYQRFMLWLDSLTYKCKIVIAGNHDGLIEQGKITFGKGVHYLCDSGLEFNGLKIWGSPYTPTFFNWYFMRDRGEDIRKHWDLIPIDTDILVTHGPPYGIFDETIDGRRVGCEDLQIAIRDRIKPRIHCFGHIHEDGNKKAQIEGTTYINCSYVDERYRPVHAFVRLVIDDPNC
ncbi:MAG: metallophosphatase domain-containing protein [Candidatus Protochlamydia sp.]|nr:metallophosphatase domain-containing protein [Candidatus Protochlamydia sp.]